MTLTETAPGHIIDVLDTTIEALHVATTVLIAYAATYHTKDHPPTEVPQPIPETTADPDHILHTKQVRNSV